MMKTILQQIALTASVAQLALLVCGCNPDAFVAQIRPSVRNIAVSEDGDSAKVRFKTDDWRVYSVCVNDKTGTRTSVRSLRKPLTAKRN